MASLLDKWEINDFTHVTCWFFFPSIIIHASGNLSKDPFSSFTEAIDGCS